MKIVNLAPNAPNAASSRLLCQLGARFTIDRFIQHSILGWFARIKLFETDLRFRRIKSIIQRQIIIRN